MAAGRDRRPRPVADERGETLIEMLITIMVLGTCVVALIAGLLALVNSSDQTNQVSAANSVTQSFAEQLKQPINVGATKSAYIPCATPTGAKAYGSLSPSTLGAPGFTATVSTIDYLTAFTAATKTTPATFTFGTKCPSTDLGLQRIRLQITSSARKHTASETVTIIKRNTACPSEPGYLNPDQAPC